MTWTPLPPIVLQRAICDACGFQAREHESMIVDLMDEHDLSCGQL